MNAQQKVLIAVCLPLFVLADWVLGFRGFDAVAYTVIAVVAGLLCYAGIFLLRTKSK